MGSDAARKRPNIPSKFLNSSTTVLKGQPLPESPLILCNKDKAAIKLTTMNHPHSTDLHHHHDHNRRRRRRHNNNNNNNNDNNNQHNNNNNNNNNNNKTCGRRLFSRLIGAAVASPGRPASSPAPEKPSFGAHIVEAVHLFSSKSARPWSIGNAIDIPMHVVYISGQQLS
ncbi:hypothetical protein T09_10932 [Trichinella sp. T9]|nr:hypothetical protein T09_10932 [Trichinella sp. T9]